MNSIQSEKSSLPEIRELPIKDIVRQKSFMIRDSIDKQLVAQYKDEYDVIIQQAPISVYDTPMGLYLSDGFHRIEAGKQLEKTTISALVTKGTVQEAYAAACLANLKHGKPLTKVERIRAIKLFITIYPEWSNVKLADQLSCHEKTVRDYRTELEESKEILPQTSRIGKDGKTRPLPTKPDTATSDFSEVKQKPKRKSKWSTDNKEKLDKLYKKVKKSAFTGQKPTYQSLIDKAKELGLDVTNRVEELEEIKQVLIDSIGKQYADVKDALKDAYKRSTGMKKVLTAQIKAEETRIKKSEEDLKESLRTEVTEEVRQQVSEMTEKKRLEKLLEEIPEEFSELREWVRDGFWSIDQIKALLNNPSKKAQLVNVLENAPTKLLEGVKTGKTSLVYANTTVNRSKKHDSPPSLPDGVFDVIYADPPWMYDLPLRGSPNSHYDIMSNEDIYNLNVEGVSIQDIIAEKCVLFLWATNPKLPEALSVVKAWGFDYKTNLVWVKDKIGTGYYVRGQHELLLISIKGSIPPPIEKNRFSSVLNAPRNEHSAKPDEVYEIIETMYPNRQYLELFARNTRETWTSWGLEA